VGVAPTHAERQTDVARTGITKLIGGFDHLCETPHNRSHGGMTITSGVVEMPLPTNIYDKLQQIQL